MYVICNLKWCLNCIEPGNGAKGYPQEGRFLQHLGGKKVLVTSSLYIYVHIVLDPGKGVCADPADGGTILGKGEPDPHSRDRERQLAPDKGRGRT